jgi:hypothetical protein
MKEVSMSSRLFLGFGMASAIAALWLADTSVQSGMPAAGGGACGLGIAAGLCMIAAAIAEHGERQKDEPKNAQSKDQKP